MLVTHTCPQARQDSRRRAWCGAVQHEGREEQQATWAPPAWQSEGSQ